MKPQVEAAVKALTSILEPIMIIFVGGMVGFIVIAMYLPMFKVYDSIKEGAPRSGAAHCHKRCLYLVSECKWNERSSHEGFRSRRHGRAR